MVPGNNAQCLPGTNTCVRAQASAVIAPIPGAKRSLEPLSNLLSQTALAVFFAAVTRHADYVPMLR